MRCCNVACFGLVSVLHSAHIQLLQPYSSITFKHPSRFQIQRLCTLFQVFVLFPGVPWGPGNLLKI